MSKPKKTVSPLYMSPVTGLRVWVKMNWSELISIKDLWITGGQVWRRVIPGFDWRDAKDLDIITTSDKAETKLTELLYALRSTKKPLKKSKKRIPSWDEEEEEVEEDDTEVSSRTSFGGDKYNTVRGVVDTWKGDKIRDELRRYTKSHSEKRMAYSPSKDYLIILPGDE